MLPPTRCLLARRCRSSAPPQSNSSHPQASKVEDFISRSQAAGRQQQARTAWLVAQQRLEQEAADCEAGLVGWLEGGSIAAAELHSSASGDCSAEPSGGSSNAPAADQLLLGPDASDALQGAVAAAAAAASLLSEPGGGAAAAGPAVLLAVEEHVKEAGHTLANQLAAAEDGARRLLSGARQQFAAACRPPGGDSSASLQDRVLLLCAQHPLAAPACTAQLLEQAAEAQACHSRAMQERRTAWSAFQAGTLSRQQQPLEQPGAESSHSRGAQLVLEPFSPAEPPLELVSSGSGSSQAGEGSECLAADGTDDGWSSEEHAVFVWERRLCMAPGGGGEAALLRQLAALLPGRTPLQVRAHERWHKEGSRLWGAVTQGEAGWRQEQAVFVAAAEALLSESEAGCLAAADALVLHLEAVATSLLSAAALDHQRAVRGEQQASELEHRWASAAAAADQQAARRRAAADQRCRLKQLLAEHRHRQETQAAAALAAEQAAAAAAAREAAAAAAAGKQRVQLRQQLVAARGARRQLEQQQRQAAEQRRQAALEQLRRQVAPAVPRDAARAMAATQSSAAAAAALGRQHGLFAGALGFTADQVLQDQRFKVRGAGGWARVA